MVGLNPGLALLLIPLLPLAAGLIAQLLLRRSAIASAGLGIAGLLGSAALGLQLLSSQFAPESHPVRWSRPWVSLSELDVPLALSAGLAQLMFVVTAALLAAAVLVYAIRDRRGDPRAGAFHANLTLFAGSMLLLLCADTLLLLYAAWELLGVFSFVLIAHTGTAEAKRAAKQAFWTTRATDFGLLFAILIMLNMFGWGTLSRIDVGQLAQLPPEAQHGAVAWITSAVLLVLLAVLGKSAQWPLSFWLADAMAAPAPVSALLHAATLVAAGPYLLTRLTEMTQTAPLAMGLIAAAGALTCLLGGLMAYHAREPKRILAYSTVSQLGLCIAGLGLLAERQAFIQLLAHAWCKAALFLAVGVILSRWHAAHDHAPATAASTPDGGSGPKLSMLRGTASGLLAAVLGLGALALSGVPLLGGAWGKEQIVWAALTRATTVLPQLGLPLGEVYHLAAPWWQAAGWLLVLSLPVTAAYMTRLAGLLLTRPAGEPPQAAQASGNDGWQPGLAAALVLALLGAFGMIGVYHWFAHLPQISADRWAWIPGGKEPLVMGASLLAALFGAGWAWFCAVQRAGAASLPAGLPGSLRANPLAEFFAHGMYLREFWHRTAASAGWWLAVLAGRTEVRVMDALAVRTGRLGRGLAAASAWFDQHVVDGLRWQACELWWRIRRVHGRYLQNGDVQHYMLVILLSAVVLCIVMARPLSHIFARVINRL